MTAVDPGPRDGPSLTLRRYGPAPGSHAHEHFQLLWGWRGRLELEIAGRGAVMAPGQLAVIAPGERHDFWSREGSACFVLDTYETDPALARLAGRAWPAAPATGHLLRFLAARLAAPAAEAGSASPPGMAAGLAEAAAALLLTTLDAPAAPVRARRSIDWAALDDWIDARLHEPIAVAQLAARVHLSPSQFAARCLEETGRAPATYLRERRLAAAWRLRRQGLPVQEVAARVGYRSPSALTAALRRLGR